MWTIVSGRTAQGISLNFALVASEKLFQTILRLTN